MGVPYVTLNKQRQMCLLCTSSLKMGWLKGIQISIYMFCLVCWNTANFFRILFLPDLHKVKSARWRGALQFKVGEIQHNLHVDIHNDLKNAVSIVGIVVRVVGWTKRPCKEGEGLTTVWWEKRIKAEPYNHGYYFIWIKSIFEIESP